MHCSETLDSGADKNAFLVLSGETKDKKTLLTVHQTLDFRQVASLVLDDNLEICCLKRVTDGLLLAGGKESLHLFEFDEKASALKPFRLNCLETGDLVHNIVGKDRDFYAVTIKGLINFIKVDMA